MYSFSSKSNLEDANNCSESKTLDYCLSFIIEVLERIYPDTKFNFTLVSRLTWRNAVFCAVSENSLTKLSVKVFLKSYKSKYRFICEKTVGDRLEFNTSSIRIPKLIHYEECAGDGIIEGVLIRPWIIGDSFMHRLTKDPVVFLQKDFPLLVDCFKHLWSVNIESFDKKTQEMLYLNEYIDTGLIMHKLHMSEDEAFKIIFTLGPELLSKIRKIYDFYKSNIPVNEKNRKLINGDPSAHEFLVNQSGIWWIDWESTMIHDPMVDVSCMYYSIVHNFYDDPIIADRYKRAFFSGFEITDKERFVYYFIEKIVLVEIAIAGCNDKKVFEWSITHAADLLDEIGI